MANKAGFADHLLTTDGHSTFEKALTAKPEFSGVSGHMVGETGANAANGLGVAGAVPVRVQLSRKRGWRMPPNTVKVDRTNKVFGNPFTIGCDPSQFSAALPDTCETVKQAVAYFAYYADTWMAITGGRWIDRLRGKNLACWCPLDAPCHADVLLELANTPTPQEARHD